MRGTKVTQPTTAPTGQHHDRPPDGGQTLRSQQAPASPRRRHRPGRPTHPIDIATVQSTIDEAQALRGSSAEPRELADLELLLRGHIAELLVEAKDSADLMWRGSMEWSLLTGRLSGIRFQAGRGLGEGVLSAHVQIAQLALDCQWLLDEYGGGAEHAVTPETDASLPHPEV
ncbi:DUF6415 family natural product biosynthesis protein [Streptomyces sp. NPDC048612]|uniref:DUF6415 family natural product biosynthesis protein n=1 Tax=Streptomyces sp. NPDC048612 TaxID=3365579 RepID=UPI003722F0DD